jgi:hypothetical protein
MPTLRERRRSSPRAAMHPRDGVPARQDCAILGHAGPILHRMSAFTPSVLRISFCLSCVLATLGPAAAEQRTASGWLQLERDQRTYRERVAPLDLQEQRELGVIERSQRNDLRALEQRVDRAEQLDRRREAGPDRARPVPRRDYATQRRRALEQQRLDVQTQQQGLPYGRRPAAPTSGRPVWRW